MPFSVQLTHKSLILKWNWFYYAAAAEASSTPIVKPEKAFTYIELERRRKRKGEEKRKKRKEEKPFGLSSAVFVRKKRGLRIIAKGCEWGKGAD